MSVQFAIVDLFAGPGGLAEGFASVRDKDGGRPFRIVLSVEKEQSAFETLRFRSFFRQFDAPPIEYYRFLKGDIAEPDWEALFPVEWNRAKLETMKLELGSPTATKQIDARLREITNSYGNNVILVGGPPCQAYSLVGRARNKGTEGYDAKNDHRHFLYKEYIRILQKLTPAAFVMENVKGLLSSSIDGERVFDQVLDDLSKVGGGKYTLVPLTPRSRQPSLGRFVHPPAFDFVVRAEDHGIPQSRHRVIIVGIRADPMRDRITILAEPKTFKDLAGMRNMPAGRDILLSAVYLPAVMDVLALLQSGETSPTSKSWYRVFKAKCDDLAIDPAAPDQSPLAIAQKLLRAPLKKSIAVVRMQ
jgi:DNA (cytosine-5)-methyltransferase 1